MYRLLRGLLVASAVASMGCFAIGEQEIFLKKDFSYAQVAKRFADDESADAKDVAQAIYFSLNKLQLASGDVRTLLYRAWIDPEKMAKSDVQYEAYCLEFGNAAINLETYLTERETFRRTWQGCIVRLLTPNPDKIMLCILAALPISLFIIACAAAREVKNTNTDPKKSLDTVQKSSAPSAIPVPSQLT